MACGRVRGVKARERRVWVSYRGRCAPSGARGLRSWAQVLTLGSPYMWRTSLTRGGIGGRRRALLLMGELFAGEVLTYCSRTRIVERNCKCSIRVGCAMRLGLVFGE